METRDILNKDSEVVGKLSMPDDTPEEKWEVALAAYTEVPVNEPSEVIQIEITGKSLVRDFKNSEEILKASPEELDAFFKNMSDIFLRLREGFLSAALFSLETKSPEGLLTQELIDYMKDKIKEVM